MTLAANLLPGSVVHDEFTKTAILIAKRVAPDEVDLAPTLIEGIAKGGPMLTEARRRDTGPTFGGMGGAEVGGELLAVFEALRHSPSLLPLFRDLAALGASTLAVLVHWLALRDRRRRRAEEKLGDNIDRLEKVVQELESSLQSSGVADIQARKMSLDVVEVLLSDSDRGCRFLTRLSEVR